MCNQFITPVSDLPRGKPLVFYFNGHKIERSLSSIILQPKLTFTICSRSISPEQHTITTQEFYALGWSNPSETHVFAVIYHKDQTPCMLLVFWETLVQLVMLILFCFLIWRYDVSLIPSSVILWELFPPVISVVYNLKIKENCCSDFSLNSYSGHSDTQYCLQTRFISNV